MEWGRLREQARERERGTLWGQNAMSHWSSVLEKFLSTALAGPMKRSALLSLKTVSFGGERPGRSEPTGLQVTGESRSEHVETVCSGGGFFTDTTTTAFLTIYPQGRHDVITLPHKITGKNLLAVFSETLRSSY